MTTSSIPSASDVLKKELPWLRALAQRLASPAEAEDLVQDTWIAAWQHAPAHEDERSLRPWLARVLRNRAHNRSRADRRRRARDEAAQLRPSAVADPDAELRRFEVLQVLMGLVSALPAQDRRILTRRFADEQNATEIGTALGVAPATVRSRLRRALERLREELDEHHGGRAAWAVVLAPMPAVGRVGVGAKMGAGIAVALTVGGGVAAMSSSGGPNESASNPARVLNAAAEEPPPPEAPETTKATAVSVPAASSKAEWRALQRQIRAANEAEPKPESEPDFEELAPVLAATSQLQNEVFTMCVADVGLSSGESLTVVSNVVGAPDLGTIVTETRIEGDVTARDELLECLTESMVSLRGPAPPVAVETEMSFSFGDAAPGAGKSKPRPLPELSLLEPEQRRAIEAHHRTLSPKLAACDEYDPGATGSATMRVTLDTKGIVASARFVETTLDLGIVDCMAEAIVGSWQFEGLPEGTVLDLHETLPAE